MVNDRHMNDTTMLGTYILEGDVPIEPEIVLTNCTDAAMAGQLMSAFQGNPDIRFFLLQGIDEDTIDLNADFHFLRDNGNWVLANHNTMMDVFFDDAEFNPSGTEPTFSLTQAEDGSWLLTTGDELHQAAYLPPSDQLLVDMGHDDVFTDDHTDVGHTGDPETFFIDPSVLAQGENEILITNFTLGHDTLELPDGLTIKDVVVDTEHDLTEVVLSGADTPDDIVVKLLGVNQSDLPGHDLGLPADGDGDDLINYMIHSGLHTN